jgi:hypothetical protein
MRMPLDADESSRSPLATLLPLLARQRLSRNRSR